MRKRWFAWLLQLWRQLPIPKSLRWAAMWLINPKFLAGVSAVVLDEQGRVLLFKHTYRREFPWDLPSGWLERSEDPADAIVREIREESGMQVCIERPLVVKKHPHLPLVDLVFLGHLVEPVEFRPSLEVSESGFFTLETAPHIARSTRELILFAVQQVKRGS